MLTVLVGDVMEQLASLPDESVQCVVTSPPYFGLRDYGTAKWDGGDEDCDHLAPYGSASSTLEGGKSTQEAAKFYRNTCGKCGATRIDNQIGLERTPAEYVDKMVAVFREVRRVLRDDGTCWVNLGDTYARNPQKGASGTFNGRNGYGEAYPNKANIGSEGCRALLSLEAGTRAQMLAEKNLVGIPWRVAFGLQADGWWLRSDIIWSKPNPMPESVTDRPTKSHEYIFLLSKKERYYFDQDAVREPNTDDMVRRAMAGHTRGANGKLDASRCDADTLRGVDAMTIDANGRNIRSVWNIATQPYPEAHFATFPEEIPKRCILAGTSARGCCPECGAPWERVTETNHEPHPNRWSKIPNAPGNYEMESGRYMNKGTSEGLGMATVTKTLGWQPTCTHNHEQTKPCTVLDPFAGSGTVLKVALELGRRAIGIELNPEYAKMIDRRCQTTLGLAL